MGMIKIGKVSDLGERVLCRNSDRVGFSVLVGWLVLGWRVKSLFI